MVYLIPRNNRFHTLIYNTIGVSLQAHLIGFDLGFIRGTWNYIKKYPQLIL